MSSRLTFIQKWFAGLALDSVNASPVLENPPVLHVNLGSVIGGQRNCLKIVLNVIGDVSSAQKLLFSFENIVIVTLHVTKFTLLLVVRFRYDL